MEGMDYVVYCSLAFVGALVIGGCLTLACHWLGALTGWGVGRVFGMPPQEPAGPEEQRGRSC